MLLITTCDAKFWDHQGKSLALGTWCLSGDSVLPHPWNGSEIRHKKFAEVDGIYEALLPKMALELNEIHGLRGGEGYWRVIIGPWLKYALEIFYERYECLIAAQKYAANLSTRISGFQPRLAENFDEFIVQSVGDELNLWIYSEMIRQLGLFPFEERPFFQAVPTPKARIRLSWKDAARSLLVFLGQIGRTYRLYIKDCSLQRFKQWQLSLRFGSWPRWAQITVPRQVQANEKLAGRRHRREPSIEGNLFENLALSLIWQVIPRCYLENFASLRGSALARYPKSVKTILSGNSYHADESFKIWCAEQIQINGARLIAEQHGGLYGTGRYSSMENHEAKIASRYLTWGWTRSDVECLPTSNGKLLAAQRELTPSPAGRLLMVERGAPRYSYWSYSSPLPHQFLEAVTEQFQFVECLDASVRSQLLVRLHSLDWGWKVRERWEEKFPDVCLSSGKTTMNEELQVSRLFIGTYNATTFLETLSANFPTVVFWNPLHWDLHERAKPLFAELKKAKIFFDSPIEAAAHVNEIFLDPSSWWSLDETQRARERFCRGFAWTSTDPMAEWQRNLQLPALVSMGDG